ncbi:PIG-L deacetylase family protein [Stieleria varia]|uniref:Mycothiol S-conjugate amidase n=1 Tax=Stieleria varia TaxID=2528005 RepID=A0A5C6B3B5_9BACT|nr:PIG-L family deacetylase [Stieleria varia]TWU05869.1 Mycothiol S-conjugate amidase [Stieleria varia]
MNELPEPLDVLVVAAHPDDAEVACGGTLAMLADAGHRVGVVDLTDGEPTPYSSGPQQRMEEATQAGKILGLAMRVQLDLPNRRLMDGVDERLALAKVFRTYRPRVVIGFGDKTPMASPDHYQAMQITDAAVFYSRLSKWEQQFDGLPVHPVQRQLYFRLAVDSTILPTNPFHTLIDISQTLERKLQAVACYRSQFDHKTTILERVRAAAVATGSIAGVGAAESFAAARPFATSDLFGALGLG